MSELTKEIIDRELDSIEKSRSVLDNIKGYIPPSNYNYSNKKETVYKNSKYKTQSSKNVVYRNDATSEYDISICPSCNRKCTCEYCIISDKTQGIVHNCNKNHKWKMNEDGFIVYT